MRAFFSALLFLIAICASAQLPLRLPSIISDHAVLQQNAEVKVWGWVRVREKLPLFAAGISQILCLPRLEPIATGKLQ